MSRLMNRFSRFGHLTPLHGVGTVLVSNSAFRPISEKLTPVQLARELNRVASVTALIPRKHKGLIVRFFGDAPEALWTEELHGPGHAQLAFDAACEILCEFTRLSSANDSFKRTIWIALGTGDMAGRFFQPINQYQVMGPARALAGKLLAARLTGSSSVLLTSYTANLLKPAKPLRTIGYLNQGTQNEIAVLAHEIEK